MPNKSEKASWPTSATSDVKGRSLLRRNARVRLFRNKAAIGSVIVYMTLMILQVILMESFLSLTWIGCARALDEPRRSNFRGDEGSS